MVTERTTHHDKRLERFSNKAETPSHLSSLSPLQFAEYVLSEEERRERQCRKDEEMRPMQESKVIESFHCRPWRMDGLRFQSE